MGRRAFTISLLAFLGFVILQTVSADEPSEERAAQINSNVGSLLEPSENQFRLVRSPDAKKRNRGSKSKKPNRGPKSNNAKRRRHPNRGKPNKKSGFRNKKNRKGKVGKGKGNGKENGSKGRKKIRGKKNGNGEKRPNKKPGFINKKQRKGKGGKGKGKQKGRNGRKKIRGKKIREKKIREKKKGNGNKTPGGKTANFNEKQACNEQELCKRIKLYIKYSNQQRKAKRILRTCKTMKSKHDKAGTEFEATAAAIKNSDDTNVTAIQATLATCKTTAKALCADTNVDQCSAEEQAKINACITKLKTWIDAFGPGASSCLGQASCCTCINNISPAVPDDCLNYDKIDKDSLVKKNKCTKSEEKGSFGDCRKQQQLAAEQGPPAFGKKCKNGAVTTAKPSGRKRKAVVKIRKELNIKK